MTHHLHFVGRPECVAEGCEPETPTGANGLPQSWQAEADVKAADRRPFIARRSAR